jgi:hypothetical protein
MLKSLRKKLVTLSAALSLALIPVAVPVAVSAQATPDVKGNLGCGANLQVDTGNCTPDTAGGTEKIQSIVTTVINIFSVVVGIVAVIMIIVGGFKYITSGGDSGNITSAKNTIVYAVIGLVVVALAQFFVQFVLNKVNA